MATFMTVYSICRNPLPRGRPAMEVDVEYLRSLRFSWKKIAKIIEISRRTLYRRLNEWNLLINIKYSTITDEN